jgi:CHAT domain-containing protein
MWRGRLSIGPADALPDWFGGIAHIAARIGLAACAIAIIASCPACPTRADTVLALTWNGTNDELAAGEDADTYWRSCALDPQPGHPTVADPRFRSLICMKWLLLWGDNLASARSADGTDLAAEQPRGRRFLTKAFALLRADLANSPPADRLDRLGLHRRLKMTVGWYAIIHDDPEAPALRAAALEYYLTAWRYLPDSPRDIALFEHKFELAEAVKELFGDETRGTGVDTIKPPPMSPEVSQKLLAFLAQAYTFHQLAFPSAADPEGRRYIEAEITDGDFSTVGIGYGVFPGDQYPETLPVLARSDLEAELRLLRRLAKAGAIDQASSSARIASVEARLAQARIDDIEAQIRRHAALGDRMGVVERRRRLREIYLTRNDLAAAARQQELLVSLSQDIGDQDLIAREVINRGMLEYRAGNDRAALKDLDGARALALRTVNGKAVLDSLQVAALARTRLGTAAPPSTDAGTIERLFADVQSLPGNDVDADPAALVAALRRWLDQPGHIPALRVGVEARMASALIRLHEYAEAEAVLDRVIPYARDTNAKDTELGALWLLLGVEDKRANIGRFYEILARCEQLGQELRGADWDAWPTANIVGVLFRLRDLGHAEAALRRRLDHERLAVLEDPVRWRFASKDPASPEALLLGVRIAHERGRDDDVKLQRSELENWAEQGTHDRPSGVVDTTERQRQLAMLGQLAEMDYSAGAFATAIDRSQLVLARIDPLADVDFWLRLKLVEARSLLALHKDASEDAHRFEQVVPHINQYKELGAGRAVDLGIFLGDFHFDRGETDAAAQWWRSAATSAAELGLIDEQIEVHRKLGDLAQSVSTSDQAVGEYREAVRLVRAISLAIPSDIAKVGYRGERSLAIASLTTALYDQYRAHPDLALLNEILRAVEEGKSRALTEMVWSARGAAPEPFDPAAFMAKLPSDITLIEYYVPEGVRDQMLRFVIEHDSVTVDALLPGAQQIEAEVLALKGAAKDSADYYDETDFRRRATALGSILLPPALRTGQRSGHRIFVIPTSALYLFPFGLLADERGRFLAENDRLELAYLPNAALAARPAPRLTDARRMEAYVNPARERELSGVLTAKDDAEQTFAAALSGWHAKVHWREAVTRRDLMGELGQTDNVFLYAHAAFLPRDPTSSYVRLADDDGRPSELSAEDLLHMHIGKGLWILAACSTGSGDVRSGDEVLGLPRAMLQAGASMVVVSLWDVGQKPNWELMNAMLRKISAGETTAQALREAQAEQRSAGKPPYDWAAFVLTGRFGYGQ